MAIRVMDHLGLLYAILFMYDYIILLVYPYRSMHKVRRWSEDIHSSEDPLNSLNAMGFSPAHQGLQCLTPALPPILSQFLIESSMVNEGPAPALRSGKDFA